MRMLKYSFIDWVLFPLQFAIVGIATVVFNNLTTPWLVYSHVLYVYNPQWGTSSSIGPSLLKRLLGCTNVICFAPWFLPKRIWAYFNPPPCRHHSCIVRRYLTPKPPPAPWYTCLTPRPMERLYRSLRPRRRVEQNPDASMFLRLPVEIRNLIYVYASGARPEVRYQDPWRIKPLSYHKTLNGLDIGYNYALSVDGAQLLKEYTSEQDMICYHDSQNWEDAISYQLGDDGIVAMHSAHRPPTNLLLVCQQIHNEAREQFLSTSAFEVQPLTPNHKSWNSDWNRITGSQSTYGALAQSELAPMMRKVRVRIDMSRFRQRRQAVAARWLSPDNRFTCCKFDETCLEMCAVTVAARARELCEVLRTRVPGLRVVEINWVDDYPDAVGESELEIRAKVLLPFAELEGVQIRVRKLVMSDKGRAEVMNVINRTLNSH